MGLVFSRLTRKGLLNEQTVFWAPEVLPTVLSVSVSSSQASAQPIALDLTRLSPDELRQNADGWHAVLRFGGASIACG